MGSSTEYIVDNKALAYEASGATVANIEHRRGPIAMSTQRILALGWWPRIFSMPIVSWRARSWSTFADSLCNLAMNTESDCKFESSEFGARFILRRLPTAPCCTSISRTRPPSPITPSPLSEFGQLHNRFCQNRLNICTRNNSAEPKEGFFAILIIAISLRADVAVRKHVIATLRV